MKGIALALFILIIPSISGQTMFSEGFEGDLSKWEILGTQTGNVEMTTLYAHSGTHSLMIRTNQVGGIGESRKKYLHHAFGQDGVGIVSVWFYDTGNPNATLVVLKDSSGNETSMGRMDAAGSVSPSYVYNFTNAEYISSIPYAAGWHVFAFTVSGEGTKYSIDGIVQNATNPTFKTFSEINLGTFSGVFSEQYWDDVSLSPLCTLPSPTITSPQPNYNFPTLRPSFTWSSMTDAESYTIQIISGMNVIAEKAGLTTTAYSEESDLPQDAYTFKVKSVSTNCESDWSSITFFVGTQGISVTVKVSSQGNPIQDANVSIIPGSALPYFLSAKTDASGQALFQNMATGSYTLKVEKEQFAPYIATLTIDKTTAIEVELETPPSLTIATDKQSYACNELVTLTIKGPPETSVALMVKLAEEIVYTDTVKTDKKGDGSSSFAIAKEGILAATASIQGTTSNASFSVACTSPEPPKISVKIEEYKVIDTSGNPKSSFAHGQMVGFYVAVKNDSPNAVTVLVLNQVKDPHLVSVFTGYVKVTLAPGETQEVSVGFALPNDATAGSYSCQAMVWSDWASAGGMAYDSTEMTFVVEALV